MIMYGDKVAASEKELAAFCVEELKRNGVYPKVVFLTFKNDPVGDLYTKLLVKDCIEVGIIPEIDRQFPNPQKIIDTIQKLNKDDSVHGITIQYPLPITLESPEIFTPIRAAIAPEKDVDGLRPDALYHILNQTSFLYPCTTRAIAKLLHDYKMLLPNASAVVVGRSANVGVPAAMMLQKTGATVSVIHSGTTKETSALLLKNADIVVLAAGKGHGWNEHDFKPGATIIDVGTSMKDGKLVGDFDDTSIKERGDENTLNYTPVPNGVGVVTRAEFLAGIAITALRQEDARREIIAKRQEMLVKEAAKKKQNNHKRFAYAFRKMVKKQ